MKSKLAVVAAVLRLSTKYIAPVLRRRAISLLTTAYPSTLDGWKHRATNRLVQAIENEFAVLVVLAEETDVRVLLPAVYYLAAKQPLAEVLAQIHALPVDEISRQPICTTFLLGREALQCEEVKGILRFMQPTFSRPNCKTSNDVSILTARAAVVLDGLADAEPFQDLCLRDPGSVGTTIGVCASCTDTIKAHIEGAFAELWERLSGLFGLPSWDVLKAGDDSEDAEEDW